MIRTFSLICVVVLSTSGCGDDSVPCDAGVAALSPVLAVAPQMASTQADGASVEFVAALAGTTGTIHWTLDGPGYLLEQEGESTVYHPPSADDLPTEATATITATVDGTSLRQGVTVQVQP